MSSDREEVRDIVREELAAFRAPFEDLLNDLTWRIRQSVEAAHAAATGVMNRVPAEALDLKAHVLTGYTLTPNTPTNGITWADLTIVYNGTSYGPYSSNTTSKYIWFDLDDNAALKTSATRPTLATGDTLVFINDSGTPTVMVGGGNGTLHGGALSLGSIAETGLFGSNSVPDAAVAGLSAAKVSGVLADGNIPNLNASKVNAGTFADARIPSLSTTKITSGTFDDARIPSLDTSKIATGTFGATRLSLLQHLLI